MTGQKIYELILNSNIINFLIMISVLVWIFKRFNLGSIIDSIVSDIETNVTSSAQAVKNALSKYREIKKEQRNIGTKKQEIIENANSIIKNLNETNELEIKKRENELEISKNKTLEVIKDMTKEKTVEEVKNAVYEIAKDTIKSNMTDEIQFNLIKNALDELDNLGEVKF